MKSRTDCSIISFEGEIGMEEKDIVNCIPERGHNIIFYSVLYQLHDYYVNSLGSYFRLS